MTSYDGWSAATLATRLRAPGCLVLPTVTSTLDLVHEMAADGAPAGTVVLADEQVAGRGRQGRRWYSPPGRGIWLGYLTRPETAPDGGVLALRVGLALVAAVEEVGAAVALKWPNDVVADGRKLAGVLCEAQWEGARPVWIAVGVGMNVHGPLPAALRDRAVALDELVPDVTRVAVLERLVPRLHRLPDAATLSETERDAFARHDWLAGRRLVEPVPGEARGIGADGALLVHHGGTVRRVAGGTVVTA